MNILLLTLTSLYDGTDLKNHPRINVLFTNYSRTEILQKTDDDIFEGGTEEDT